MTLLRAIALLAVLPGLACELWAPAPEPTIKTGVTAMTAAVLELAGKRN